MAQFRVYRNPDPASNERFPFLLDVQSGLLAELDTRLVAPMVAVSSMRTAPMTRLMPVFRIEGADYAMVTPQVAGIPRRLLDEPLADLAGRRDEIVAALNFLLTGY